MVCVPENLLISYRKFLIKSNYTFLALHVDFYKMNTKNNHFFLMKFLFFSNIVKYKKINLIKFITPSSIAIN